MGTNRTGGGERLRIGEIARAAGFTVEGVRFYERRGLLEPAARSEAGYRLYGRDALNRLAFIRQAQAIGLTLEEIRHVVALTRAGVPPCEEVRSFVRAKLAEVDRTLAGLKALRRRLTTTLDRWEADPHPGRGAHVCPLIEQGAPPEAGVHDRRSPTSARRRR